jgi:hypothetical protein
MQIVVEIPDEFAAQVEARGLSPARHVQRLVDDVLRSSPIDRNAGGPSMSMEEFLRKMGEDSQKIPQLPDEAFTRESFYQDHN